MKTTDSKNLNLGIFVIIGVIIFILAIYFIGNRQNLFGDNIKITAVFMDVNGLQKGNNVRLSGVNVGTVREIAFVSDSTISVDMLIENKVVHLIKKDALATINSDGLVGSMVVNILPGHQKKALPLKAGDTIKSISKIATADMLTTLNKTNENAALLTADLLKITRSINEGKGVLGSLLKDEKMVNDLKSSIAGFEETTTSARGTMNRINSILDEVNYSESVAGILLSDTTSARRVSNLLETLEQSANDINSATTNFKNFSGELRSGEGALNYVLNDTSFVNNLDATLQNAEEASARFNENMEAIKNSVLFRGYFRRLERQKAREAGKN